MSVNDPDSTAPVAGNPHAGAEYVEVGSARIDVSEAELYISPGARRASRRLAWAVVVLFVVVIGVGAANLVFTSNQVHSVRDAQAQAAQNTIALRQANAVLRRQLQADCDADRDLAGLPLANMPDGHPARLGVRIISDFRGSWHRKDCPGTLPPPDPSYVSGARFYHLPVN